MLYLNEENILAIGINWADATAIIIKATEALEKNFFSQPVKPYLRYKNPKNRIIAMPAYIGGAFEVAGIKWISSFPDNIHNNLRRAHSVIILNEENTGRPICIINTPILSGIRTSAVTGALIRKYFTINQPDKKLSFGILGYGPIGRLHHQMIIALFNEHIAKVRIFDNRTVDQKTLPKTMVSKTEISNSWEEVYDQSDIFMTCTVASSPYIDKAPPKGSLQLNVSLRDYKPDIIKYIDKMIVDNWDEVCRENTDVENMHIKLGLQKEDTISINQALVGDGLYGVCKNDTVMFNPMGMAIFDMAIGKMFYDKAQLMDIGVTLPD